MSNDKELLELAAKAAGYKISDWSNSYGFCCYDKADEFWNPLTDDGDALRLAVKLNLDITQSWSIVNGDDNYPMASIHVSCYNKYFVYELKESDSYAATRRAIVRAAAEIGRSM